MGITRNYSVGAATALSVLVKMGTKFAVMKSKFWREDQISLFNRGHVDID